MIHTNAYNDILALETIIMDGGMGQELLRQSGNKPTPLWSTEILLNNLDLVTKVHLDFIKSGARIITLNSYTCTPERIARDFDISQFENLQNKAIQAAQNARQQAADEFGIKNVAIAGCLPPLVASYHPDTCPDLENAIASYKKIAEIQAPHVDFFLCETLSSIHEANAAISAAKTVNLPIWVSFKISDTEKNTLPSTELFSDAIDFLNTQNISAALINCTAPEIISDNLEILKKFNGAKGIYPNNFKNTTDLKIGGTVDALSARTDFSTDKYVHFMHDMKKHDIHILGGCCEIGPDRIKALSELFYPS